MNFLQREQIADDQPCVLFCSVDTAEKLIDNDPEIGDCIVTSPVLSDDTVVVVSKQEFLDWLYGNEEEQE